MVMRMMISLVMVCKRKVTRIEKGRKKKSWFESKEGKVATNCREKGGGREGEIERGLKET